MSIILCYFGLNILKHQLILKNIQFNNMILPIQETFCSGLETYLTMQSSAQYLNDK